MTELPDDHGGLPPGWTLTESDRVVAYEDRNSAFTDGRQLTLRDPAGQRPPQAEWPTSWRRHAIAYAWSVHTRRVADILEEPWPPYAHPPTAHDMLPRRPHTVDPVYRPRDYQIAKLAEKARKDNPAREPDPPDRVLAHWAIHDPAELAAVCSPAKLVLGVTAKTPDGQVGPGWRWWARLGYGWRGRDGRITQSVALKFHHRERGRRALFYWTRPVPDPRLIMATLRDYAEFEVPGTFVLSVLAQLPDPTWTSELTTAWTDDMPRKVASAAVKAEIRS